MLAYGLRVKMETTVSIIHATAVLHNLAMDMYEPDRPQPLDIDDLINMGQMQDNPVQGVGHEVYQHQIIKHFTPQR